MMIILKEMSTTVAACVDYRNNLREFVLQSKMLSKCLPTCYLSLFTPKAASFPLSQMEN